MILSKFTLSLVAGFTWAVCAHAEQPNILVFLADDLGYGEISSYGGAVQTPAIDKLSAEGMRLTDAYATPFCTPTRASLMTGRYNQRTKLTYALPESSTLGLKAGEVTIAEMLGDEFDRALIGKWHLGSLSKFSPLNSGFLKFYGMLGGRINYTDHKNELGDVDWWNQRTKVTLQEYSTTAITRESLKRIDYNTARQKPWFLYVPYQAVHGPYQAPGDAQGVSYPEHYSQIVQLMDQSVGEIMTRVRALDRNTIVLFMSDNGGIGKGHNGPLRGGKGSVYEGGIRVPAVLWMPGKIKAGVNNTPVHVIDILPTLAELAEKPLPSTVIDGVSLVPVVEGSSLPLRQLFWDQSGSSAVRDGRWKLVVPNGKPTELYDLYTDIGEKQNIASANPEIVIALQAALVKWKTNVSH